MNRQSYNGLHLPKGAPTSPEQVKRAISLEMQALTREIYVRAVSISLNDNTAEDFESLARRAGLASRSFFIGLGVIEESPDE